MDKDVLWRKFQKHMGYTDDEMAVFRGVQIRDQGTDMHGQDAGLAWKIRLVSEKCQANVTT